MNRSTLNLKETAQYIGINEHKLRQFVIAGTVPHIRMGRRLLFPIAVIDKWLIERAEEGRGA